MAHKISVPQEEHGNDERNKVRGVIDDEEGTQAFDAGFDGEHTDDQDLEADAEDPQNSEEAGEEEDDRIAKLDALGAILFTYRKSAIEHRISCGIEEEWRDAQDAYEGYDDVNPPTRDTRRQAFQTRAHGVTPISRRTQKSNKSTVFLNITRPYTDASAARVADMLFPTDERPWGLQATPVPELVDAKDSQAPGMLPPQDGQPGQPALRQDGTQATEGELIEKIIDIADKKAEKAQKRIEDWLVENQWHAEARSVVNDCARLGTGVLKGPVPIKKRTVAMIDGELKVKEKIVPNSKRINPWNLFPDESCGDNIHNGSYIFERDDITHKKLADLRGLPGYIDSQINLVLDEGPQLPMLETSAYAPLTDTATSTPYDIWYYTGDLKIEDLESIGVDTSGMAEHEQVSAQLTMVNNKVIKAALNPLDSGEFPYDVLTWQAREDYWAGIGVPMQISVPQRGVNAATRAMMNNAGVTSGPQIVIMEGVIEPVTGTSYAIEPLKVWKAKKGADIQAVKDAFISINLESHQPELMAIIEFYLKMAEDVTGLPMIQQGQQGSAPDTVGGMAMLQNNSNSTQRRMARQFDDRITEPHIGRYYAWLMQYGEDPEEKGDYSIDARASSVLVERDLANNAVMQIAMMSLQPDYGADPRKSFAEMCKANKLDPKRFQYTDDEWKKIQKAQEQQPADPRITVEEMRNQAKAIGQQADHKQESEQNERERALKAGLGELNAEVDMAKLNGTGTISADKVRALLAGIAMTKQSDERMFDKEVALKMNEANTSGTGI